MDTLSEFEPKIGIVEATIFNIAGAHTGVITNEHSYMRACERSTNWVRDVNIDLKPYLKSGENEFWGRTVVSGFGESWFKIKVAD